jgi:hypothetical protein
MLLLLPGKIFGRLPTCSLFFLAKAAPYFLLVPCWLLSLVDNLLWLYFVNLVQEVAISELIGFPAGIEFNIFCVGISRKLLLSALCRLPLLSSFS